MMATMIGQCVATKPTINPSKAPRKQNVFSIFCSLNSLHKTIRYRYPLRGITCVMLANHNAVQDSGIHATYTDYKAVADFVLLLFDFLVLKKYLIASFDRDFNELHFLTDQAFCCFDPGTCGLHTQ